MLTRYLSWEMIAIHAVTAALFAAINVIIAVALVPAHWPIALAVAPLLAWSWWGFFAEARLVIRASRGMRESSRR